MTYTSLAAIVLSASTAVSPFSRLVHLHAHVAQPDTRISVTLRNTSTIFQDVMVNGRSYTIPAHQGITVKAPAGTAIYADSSTGKYRRGEKLLELSQAVENKAIELK